MIHRDQSYLCHWLGLQNVASIEPKPGVPPSAGYLGQLGCATHLRATQDDPAQCLQRPEGCGVALRARARARGAAAVLRRRTPEAADLFGLFDDTINRLLKAVQ